MEDMLKKQIQKQEYADDGGGGRIPPDNNDGSGGSGEDDFAEQFEEFIQVMLATFAFIFVVNIYHITSHHLPCNCSLNKFHLD